MNITYQCDNIKMSNPILYPKESSEADATESSGAELTKRTCKIFLTVDQIVSYAEKPGLEMHSILANETMFLTSIGILGFFVIDLRSAIVFTREIILRRQVKKRRDSTHGQAATVTGETVPEGVPEPPPREFSNFVRFRTVDMNMWIAPRENGTASPPVAFEYVPNKSLQIFAFEDGSIKVISCDFLSEEEHKRNAKLICDFSAHSSSIRSLSALNFISCFGGAYLLEFISIGLDNEIRHWGIRQRSKSDNYIADRMGVNFSKCFMYN